MNIAIVGAGNVGGALARSWIARGHAVCFGARDPNKAEIQALVKSLGARASARDSAEAVKSAEIVVLATPWPATQAAIQACGSLAGKTVVDCTNPLLPQLAGLEIGTTTSGGEQVAQWARGASVFKAFNQTGAENMSGTTSYPQKLVMFVAGDDAQRKPAVLQLARDAGFDAVDAGPLSAARLLEPLAMLWISLAYRQGLGREFGFALVRR
ncbi:MAG: NADPH-dependent F420 reductase [Planctomycetota bacterium]|nr:NADPH-dependent F420 reductase [Planctomycetota bacterium]